MNIPLISCELSVKKSPIHGYGVFADQKILANDIIEECYTLITHTPGSGLENFYFGFDEASKKNYYLPLGYGCIYNHSDHPNAAYLLDIENAKMIFQAIRPIEKGEEIFISYGKNWFDSRPNLRKKEPSLRFKLRRFLSYFSILFRFTLVFGGLLGIIALLNHL